MAVNRGYEEQNAYAEVNSCKKEATDFLGSEEYTKINQSTKEDVNIYSKVNCDQMKIDTSLKSAWGECTGFVQNKRGRASQKSVRFTFAIHFLLALFLIGSITLACFSWIKASNLQGTVLALVSSPENFYLSCIQKTTNCTVSLSKSPYWANCATPFLPINVYVSGLTSVTTMGILPYVYACGQAAGRLELSSHRL